MRSGKIRKGGGDSNASNVDSLACTIVCPLHGLRLTGSLCWLCRNDLGVELEVGKSGLATPDSINLGQKGDSDA